MIKCPKCRKTTPANEKPVSIITKQRPRIYKNEEDKIAGQGWEIVEEKLICKTCNDVEATIFEATLNTKRKRLE